MTVFQNTNEDFWAQGILASGLMVALTSWCVRVSGPVFVSLFNPLMLIVVAFLGSLLLDEKLYLGRYVIRFCFFAICPNLNNVILLCCSVLGSVLIVCGLYMVLWSKNKEMKQVAVGRSSSSKQSIEIAATECNEIEGNSTS